MAKKYDPVTDTPSTPQGINYPKILYAAEVDGLGLVASVDLNDIADLEGAPVKIARYMLVGTGALHLSAPRYLEEAKQVDDEG